MSALFTLWFPGDLQAVQQQLLADASGVDQTVTGCTGIDAATKASWESFYLGLKAFGAQSFGWFNTTSAAADQAQLLQRELYAWEQKLSTTCKLTVPMVDPTQTSGAAASSNLMTAVKYGAVIAGFVGSAYIVGKTLEWLPKPPAREKRLPARR